MTADDFRSTADVSCSNCGSGWWVTNPDEFAWTGCPDCRDDRQSRGSATVIGVGLFAALVLVAGVFGWAIGWTRGMW